MENLLGDAPFFFFATSDDDILLQVNEHLCRQLGYEKDELKGKKVDTIFTLATRIFHQTHFFPLLKMQHRANEIFISLQTKTKEEVPVILNAELKNIGGRNVHLYAGIGVSNRKKFEDELIAAKRAAESALLENTAIAKAKEELHRRLEELDRQMITVHKQSEELKQFNRVVTHELQEPLRKLSVFISLMLADNEKAAQKKAAERLPRVADQMRSIISGLQQFVWLTSDSTKTDVDLAGIVSEVLDELRKKFDDVELNVEAGHLPVVYADRDQMHLLFYQLFENAIRFRKEGTRAKIKFEAKRLMKNRFRNIEGKYRYAPFFQIDINDDGIGFAAEFKDEAFELFKRMHKQSGLGLGLSLCKKIIDNHEGMISIDTVPGKGTTVSILLPDDAAHGMKNDA